MASSPAAEDEATLSLPSLAFVAFLGYFIYRYFISARTSSSSSASSSSSSSTSSLSRRLPGQRFSMAQVEQITAMFPQLSQRDVMWDLQRNGGSVAATTERVLGGRGLDPAPPSFQPPIPPPPPATASLPRIPLLAKRAQAEPDLITRYNLQSKINPKGKGRAEPEGSGNGGGAAGASAANGWSTSKEARQATLQRRRDEMILAARRKLLEKDEEEEGGGGGGAGLRTLATTVPAF